MRKSTSNVFVALLRGVNVGGNNMISMASLKKSFEAMGFTDVLTYINSGNIIFKSREGDARKLERKLEQMLTKEYQLESKVVLRNIPEMQKIVESLPRTWTADRDWRYNVIFLRHTIDSETILGELEVKEGIEEVVYCPGALFWSARVVDLNRTTMLKLSSRKMYQDMTIRNVNTTRKLHELMKKASDGK